MKAHLEVACFAIFIVAVLAWMVGYLAENRRARAMIVEHWLRFSMAAQPRSRIAFRVSIRFFRGLYERDKRLNWRRIMLFSVVPNLVFFLPVAALSRPPGTPFTLSWPSLEAVSLFLGIVAVMTVFTLLQEYLSYRVMRYVLYRAAKQRKHSLLFVEAAFVFILIPSFVVLLLFVPIILAAALKTNVNEFNFVVALFGFFLIGSMGVPAIQLYTHTIINFIYDPLPTLAADIDRMSFFVMGVAPFLSLVFPTLLIVMILIFLHSGKASRLLVRLLEAVDKCNPKAVREVALAVAGIAASMVGFVPVLLG